MQTMKKIALSLYVIGTVMIIKSIFRFGIIDGAVTTLIGFLLIVLAYYINNYSGRY